MRLFAITTALLFSVALVQADLAKRPSLKSRDGHHSDHHHVSRGGDDNKHSGSHSSGSHSSGDKSKHSPLIDASRITFYSGGQLEKPACGGETPKPTDMIAAVKKNGKFKCHDKINITNGNKHVQVTVVDYCESCAWDAVDLTPGAFKQLADLSAGVLTQAKMSLQR